MLAISRLSSSLHSSYCSSNSSPPSYPLIRTPSVSKPRYLLFTPKKVWWLLVLDVHPPLMYGKLWFVHLMVGLPSSDHPWQKKPLINHFPIQMPTDGGFPTDFPLIWWPGVPIYGFRPNHPSPLRSPPRSDGFLVLKLRSIALRVLRAFGLAG